MKNYSVGAESDGGAEVLVSHDEGEDRDENRETQTRVSIT